jgi:hypothetical protein
MSGPPDAGSSEAGLGAVSGPRRDRPTPPIGVEFRGKARALLSRVAAEQEIALPIMLHVGDKIRARAARHPVPRRDDLEQWCSVWRRLPATMRVMMLDCGIEGRSCHATDVRLIAARQHHASWGPGENLDEREPCLCVVGFNQYFNPQIGFTDPPKYDSWINVRCSLSLHCVARAFERWRPSDRNWRHSYIRATDHDVLAALLPLAQLYDGGPQSLCDEHGKFEIAAAACDGGVWSGLMVSTETGAVLAARTFIRDET